MVTLESFGFYSIFAAGAVNPAEKISKLKIILAHEAVESSPPKRRFGLQCSKLYMKRRGDLAKTFGG